MHLMTLACDLDGTLAEDGRIAPETWRILRRLKGAGWSLILVTGRVLQTFAPEGPYAELFDAIVAEDGAVVYFPRRDIVTLPFGRLDEALLARLETLEIPLERGLAIVATWVPHDLAILQVLHEIAGGAMLEYNRGAVMVLPPGATKGTGLQYALHELGFSPHNVIACGDAENDHSMFSRAEIAVAVANATEDLRERADIVLPEPNGMGMRAFIAGLLRKQLPVYRARKERMLHVGTQSDGMPVFLDAFRLVEGALAIVGSSGGGKSWLAGLLAEEVLKQEYQICVIDPEGDHGAMRAFPHTLLLGGEGGPLPPPEDIVTLCEYAEMSLVLDLSLTLPEQRPSYVAVLLRELWSLRAQHGRPHWLLIDEAQSLCACNDDPVSEVLDTLLDAGGIGLVSYRPSQVAPRILARIDQWLITRLDSADEQAHIAPFLQRTPDWAALRSTLAIVPRGQALFCQDTQCPNPPAAQQIIFRSEPRTVPHIRHLHKYLATPLPYEKRFFFHDERGKFLGQSAANLWEFQIALSTLPIPSLRYHLQRGDFERWISQTLRDKTLAALLNKLARRGLEDGLLRDAIITIVRERYEELDSLI